MKKWQLTHTICLCEELNNGKVPIDQTEELFRVWQPIHKIYSCERADNAESPERTNVLCNQKGQHSILDNRYTEEQKTVKLFGQKKKFVNILDKKILCTAQEEELLGPKEQSGFY